MKVYRYSGTVVELGSRRGIAKARIEVWDLDNVSHDLVDCTFTDAGGAFSFALDASLVDGLFLGRAPVAYFKVWNGVTLVANTHATLSWHMNEAPGSGRIEIAQPMTAVGKDPPSPWVVRGRVVNARTGPIHGAVVHASHKNLRTDTELGRCTTDAQGAYQISYGADVLLHLGKERADLVVSVLDATGAHLADAPVVFQAPATAEVDLLVGGSVYLGPAEADTLVRALDRAARDVRPATLSAADQAFLASAEALDPVALRTLIAADTLAADSTGATGPLYAIGRAGIALTVRGIFGANPGKVRSALEAAVATNRVAIPGGKTLDDLHRQVNAAAVRAALAKSADGLVASLGDVLSMVVSAPAAQEEFLTRYLNRTSTADFWASLSKSATVAGAGTSSLAADVAAFSSTGTVGALKLSFDIASLTGSHLPLVRALVVDKIAGPLSTLRDLAKLDTGDWTRLLRQTHAGKSIGAPAGATGATGVERIASYAAQLTTTLETAFPTAAIAGRLVKANRPADADVRTFLADNPDFDFTGARVAAYLAKNPKALKRTGKPDAATAALKGMERVFKLTAKPEEMDILIQGGIDSARAVESMGKSAFLAKFGHKLGPAAQDILDRSCFMASAVQAVRAKYDGRFNSLLVRALPALALTEAPIVGPRPAPTVVQVASAVTWKPKPVYLPPEMADWQTLFGKLDLCQCQECESVYGPSAYLVDMLEFLGGVAATVVKPGTPKQFYSARDLLIGPSEDTKGFHLVGRRPDIGHIALDCDNDNTPVPYVDLLNEILECKVVSVSTKVGVTFPSPAQTTGDPADLAANRQILADESTTYGAAYKTLSGVQYPWSLPFDRAAEEAKAHLSLLGVPPLQLMRTLSVAPLPASELAYEIAAVSLGLGPLDRAIVTGMPLGTTIDPASYWNLQGQAGWEQKLLVADTFLAASGLPYADLLELLDATLLVPFLANGTQPPTLALKDPTGSDCDLSNLVIIGLDAKKLTTLWPLVHRFLRLRAKIGLTITELDKTLTVFTAPGATAAIGDAMLQRIAVILDLREQLGTPLLELLSWWGPVDCRPSPLTAQPRLFDLTFLNPALSNNPAPTPEDEAAFVAIRDGQDPSTIPAGVTGPQLLDHITRIVAASQISVADFMLLMDDATCQAVLHLDSPLQVPTGLTYVPFTRNNVSTVFRHASLARALGLSVSDLLQLMAMAVAGPFNAADLTQATLFVQETKRVRGSAFSVPEIVYLVRNLVDPAGPSSLSYVDAQRFVGSLLPGLSKILSDTRFTAVSPNPPLPGNAVVADDPTGATLKKLLGTQLAASDVAAVMAAMTGAPLPTGTTATPAQILTTDLAFLDPSVAAQLVTDLTAHPAPSVAHSYGYLTAAILFDQRRRDSTALVERMLATALRLDGPMIKELVTAGVRSSQPNSALMAITDFLPPMTPTGPAALAASDLPYAVPTYLRLQKAATLVQKLDIAVGELGASTDSIDVNTLPITPSGLPAPVPPSSALFRQWEQIVDTFAVRDRLQAGPTALFQLIKAASGAPALGAPAFAAATLGPVTGWPVADILLLIDACGLAYPGDFTTETAYVALANAFDVLGQLGVSASTALAWAHAFSVPMAPSLFNTPYPATIATDIKKAAKAKYDAAGWLVAEKPVSDALRDRQRASMVSYLLFNTYDPLPPWSRVYQTDADIYADLLVDVDTSPSVQASRVSLAIGSTQLFVQRCLLGLEQVTLTADEVEQWKWMKQYRVWEANREIFLYPENWMVPALRDDKTDLFKSLEKTLSKHNVTSDVVEDGLRTYLEGLLDVARLEIAAVYFQAAVDDGDAIYHVFGRTRGTPTVYYYRQWIGRRSWTPWEQVSVNIEGSTVIPMAIGGRLFLFWPIVHMKSDPPPFTVPVKTGSPSKQHLEIQIAWSERKHDRWTGKQVAQGLIKIPSETVGHLTDAYGYDTVDDMIRGSLFFTTEITPSPPKIRCGYDLLGELTYSGEAIWDPCSGTVSCSTYPELTAKNVLASTFLPDLPIGARLEDNQPSLTKNDLAIDQEEDVPWATAMNQSAAAPMVTVLTSVPSPFGLVFSRQWEPFDTKYPFFMQDATATFLIEPRNPTPLFTLQNALLGDSTGKWYRFYLHDQPYVCTFLETLNRYGLTGANRWSNQVQGLQAMSQDLIGPKLSYQPADAVLTPYARADVDFTFSGAYAPYNWELFFHVPLLVATSLSKNQQFEDAHAWFQTIFDPTAAGQSGAKGPVKSRIWKVRPFAENTDLGDLATEIATAAPATQEAQILKNFLNGLPDDAGLTWDFTAQIEEWRNDPFNPYLIGRMRPVAFQKMVVMRYLDNLIAWGDQLYRRDTIESINEATQLYVLAAEVLGPRPTIIPAPGKPASLTYWQLAASTINSFSDAMVELEGVVGVPQQVKPCPSGQKPPTIRGLYFCVPPNDRLLAYWDTVADRLFKIRHSMNIAGVVQHLPLYAPPIDPALLVAAAAAGVDIDTVLEDVSGPVPVYRFAALLPKAQEVAAGVSQLGASLLAALEKGDGEALAQLRTGQELALLQLISDVKQRQVDEAQANVDALTAARAVVAARQTYYHGRTYMNAAENAAMAMSGTAMIMQAASQAAMAAGGSAQLAPTAYAGNVGPLPSSLVAEGGENIGGGGVSMGQGMGMGAAILHEEAALIATQGSYQRRMEDWQFQASLADTEHEQVTAQLTAAQIRLDIANRELNNHEQQVENAQAISDFLRGKFTNQDLYDWMSGQLSAVYFQAYQMAYQVAKRAERAYQIELAAPKESFVDPGNWDNLRQGLLAGEKLQFDLRRMELQYLDENVREFEITKTISLAEAFPENLLELAMTGATTLSLPESLFDADYPGHYLRRLRTVSLGLPGVAGPYTSVNCTLTQMSSTVRMDTRGTATSLVQSYVSIQKVVTSGGTNDAGLFEQNLHDERYLPFEGSGVISTWRIELPAGANAFDTTALDDVVMQLKYTARDGGAAFQSAVKGAMASAKTANLSAKNNLPTWLVRASADQATAWYQLKNPPPGSTAQILALDLSRFPYLPGGGVVSVIKLEAVAQGTKGQLLPLSFSVSTPGNGATYTLTTPTSASFAASTLTPVFNAVSLNPPVKPWAWTFSVSPTVDLSQLVELWIRISYTQGS
jgi:hypothetical protein